MPRLQALLECVGQSLCEKGRKALQGQWSFADVMPEVVKSAFDYAHRKLPGTDLRPGPGRLRVGRTRANTSAASRELIAELATTHSVPKAELADYLRALPATVRQSLRRPSDPSGQTAPEMLTLYKAEELAVFLPPRLPRFQPGDKPAGLDGWTLTELRGFGPLLARRGGRRTRPRPSRSPRGAQVRHRPRDARPSEGQRRPLHPGLRAQLRGRASFRCARSTWNPTRRAWRPRSSTATTWPGSCSNGSGGTTPPSPRRR